jgi:hypothetical protein
MSKAKANWAVAAFFIFYFIVLQFFNDWQYRSFINGGDHWGTFRYRCLSTPFLMLAYYLYYRLFIPFLLNKKFRWFLLLLPLFIIFLEGYGQIMDWIMWHGPFQSETTRKNAKYNWGHYRFPRQSFHLTFLNLLSITGFAYFLNRWKEEKTIRELKEQHLQMELNFLKVQIQPHFFFNTLNNIYALTIQKSDKAAPLIAKHAEIMRYVLYESSREQVRLKQEVDFLKNYVEVESMHYSEKMDIHFETQGINELVLIEPMLLLPFVENSFKHGIREETGKGYAHIVISLVEDDLFIEIKNSKPQNVNEKKINGIGLLNASKRLQMLYPGTHKIEIQEDFHSYELRLSLILKLNDQLHHS